MHRARRKWRLRALLAAAVLPCVLKSPIASELFATPPAPRVNLFALDPVAPADKPVSQASLGKPTMKQTKTAEVTLMAPLARTGRELPKWKTPQSLAAVEKGSVDDALVDKLVGQGEIALPDGQGETAARSPSQGTIKLGHPNRVSEKTKGLSLRPAEPNGPPIGSAPTISMPSGIEMPNNSSPFRLAGSKTIADRAVVQTKPMLGSPGLVGPEQPIVSDGLTPADSHHLSDQQANQLVQIESDPMQLPPDESVHVSRPQDDPAFLAPATSAQSIDPPPVMAQDTSSVSSEVVQAADPPSHVGLHASNVPNFPHVSHGPYGRYLDRYRVRAAEIAEEPAGSFAIESQAPASTNADIMWWEEKQSSSLGFSPQTMPVDIQSLTETALSASPLVRSILARPHIRQSEIVVADSEFDPTVFLETRYTDTSEPVGSSLTTGDNSDRYRDETFSSVGGIRKKTRAGGALEVSQRGGFQSNNSQFLTPNPQGTTRLEVNFTQPLMRDGGRAVNNAQVVLAQLDLQVTNAQVRQDLEDHLVSVTRSYWDLYLARADWMQRNRLLESAERLSQILEARDGVDSQRRQILRARAALTSRRSELVRAATRIRDIQAQLRLLTGSQQMANSSQWELAPQDSPMKLPVELSTQQSVVTALDNRSDIAQAIRTIQAVSTRVGAARNQVLPRLDLILGSYVAGLKDDRDPLGAWVNQLDTGRPTYWAGLSYEIPIKNRASKARLNRNRWELAQAFHDFQQATEVAFTEVEVAVRETKTAYSEMVAKTEAIRAASNEVAYLQQRWEILPDPNESAVLLIENLLDAQQRLADEELAVVTAQVSYALSWIQLRKATGVLLRFDDTNSAIGKPVADVGADAEIKSLREEAWELVDESNAGEAPPIPFDEPLVDTVPVQREDLPPQISAVPKQEIKPQQKAKPQQEVTSEYDDLLWKETR